MKHSEKGETIWQEENEVIARGFGSRLYPAHLRHSALQEMANEKHTYYSMDVNKKHSTEHTKLIKDVFGHNDIGEIKILGKKIKNTGKVLKGINK